MSNITSLQIGQNKIQMESTPDYENGVQVPLIINEEVLFTPTADGFLQYTLTSTCKVHLDTDQTLYSGDITAYIKINDANIVYFQSNIGKISCTNSGILKVKKSDVVKIRGTGIGSSWLNSYTNNVVFYPCK